MDTLGDSLKELNYYYRQKETNVRDVDGMTQLDGNVGLSTNGRVSNESDSSVIESDESNECSSV